MAIAVCHELGDGFLESVYRRALLIALRQAGLKAVEEVTVPVFFRGFEIGVFSADLIVENVVLLELKIGDRVEKRHEAQLNHYLRSTEIEVGYVLVFGEKLHIRRSIFHQ